MAKGAALADPFLPPAAPRAGGSGAATVAVPPSLRSLGLPLREGCTRAGTGSSLGAAFFVPPAASPDALLAMSASGCGMRLTTARMAGRALERARCSSHSFTPCGGRTVAGVMRLRLIKGKRLCVGDIDAVPQQCKASSPLPPPRVCLTLTSSESSRPRTCSSRPISDQSPPRPSTRRPPLWPARPHL